MSNHKNIAPTNTSILTERQQKELIIKAIEKRFPGTDFKEWAYSPLGHMLNFYDEGHGAADYSKLLTNLVIYLADKNLIDSVKREVNEHILVKLKDLIRHFSFISDSEEFYPFICHFALSRNSMPPHCVVDVAKSYLTGKDLEDVLAANPDAF